MTPSKTKKKRVVIYARVSTTDKGQDPETQTRLLREYSDRRDWEVVSELIEFGSGRNAERKKYKELLRLARRREVDVVLVYRYNRFARSTMELVKAVEEFKHLGIDFVSYHEQVDTTSPQGKFFFTIIAGFAELEADFISQNVRDGLARARANGKVLGQPSKLERYRDEIRKLLADGASKKAIARETGLSYNAVKKYIGQIEEEGSVI